MKVRDKAFEIYATREIGDKKSSTKVYVTSDRVNEALQSLNRQGFLVKSKRVIDKAVYLKEKAIFVASSGKKQ